MDLMENKLVHGLILAAVSALTYVAYKHPKAYDRLLIKLSVLFAFVNIVLITWSAGGDMAHRALLKYIELDKRAEARFVVESYQPSIWFFVMLLALYAYLFALSFLHRLLDHDKPKQD